MRISSALTLATALLLGASCLPAFAQIRTQPRHAMPQSSTEGALELGSGWQMQDAAKITDAAAAISSAAYQPASWYKATVPGTALSTLVDNKVYPDPMYGESNRPEIIPDTLARTSWWYRTAVTIPAAYAGKHTLLHFDGINYAAEVWVNGAEVGTLRGAFARGLFDISGNVKPGRRAVIAVHITPQPHPGHPYEHTVLNGLGKNGGITALDGPTFLSTIGWDWIPGIRDRDTGLWRKVFLSASGPVRLEDPLVTTDLPLPRTDSADVTVQTTVENITNEPQRGVLHGDIGTVHFEKAVELAPNSSQIIRFDPTATPVLHWQQPKLWWPNGYGPQNLYQLKLRFVQNMRTSDTHTVSFGVRKLTYAVPDNEFLTISVNGVRVFIRGGNWGLDDAMKRLPRERLEAQIHMHALANMNLIRNWVGQSTNEDFYDLCDKYGILLWDEFFQPNPSDGPDPEDLLTYMNNVREKILRYRNHPAIAVWCARNEGYPPKVVDDRLRVLLAELEPTRLYQPSSTAGRGVSSHGPYFWREPRKFYIISEDAFKTETGSMSVPTLESIHGMMPQNDWESINDDWAEHDFAKGAQAGDKFPGQLASRYGKPNNLADFVRKSQMMNYEAYRAMYEGRNAQMFKATTGVITWMSHPAQPSFVWQLYHYDLEPNSSLFAVRSAAEQVHIQLNESTGELQVVNNRPTEIAAATAHVTFYSLDGTVLDQKDLPVTVPPSSVAGFGVLAIPATAGPVYLLNLDLSGASGTRLSRNLYWRAKADTPDDLTALNTMPQVALTARLQRTDRNGKTTIQVTLQNPTPHIALKAHLQLRRASGDRVLPVFYNDNYLSLLPNETRVVTMEADTSLVGPNPIIAVDGWNVTITPSTTAHLSIAPNADALTYNQPGAGMPLQTTGLRQQPTYDENGNLTSR